jgi:peptidoglycan/xylan/chitin deacetylase (PgdA/CDA1 family)
MLNYRTVNAVFFPLLTIITISRIYFYEINWVIYPVLTAVYLFLIILGAFKISMNYYLKSFCKGKTDEKIISLTFDDGPEENFTPVILDCLKRNNIKACFFVIGSKVSAFPQLVKRMDQEGHIIGNHTYNHTDFFDFLPPAKMRKEITDTENAIFSAIGKRPLLFRPPFGVTNPLVRWAIRKTYQFSIGWSLRSYDTKIEEKDKILLRVEKVKPGDILLFHDNKKITSEILQDIIDLCLSKGYKFVNLDELIKRNAYV